MIKLTKYLTIDCEADNNEIPFIVTICNTYLKVELIYPRTLEGHNRINKICQDKKIQKIFHSATSDINFLSNVNIRVLPPYHDTLIMASLVDENFAKRNLKVLSMRYLDDPCPDYQDLKKVKAKLKREAKKKGHSFDWQDIPKEIIEPYAIQDAVRTMKLFYVFKDLVFKKYKKIYDMEISLIPIIHAMKKRGMMVDRNFCKHEIGILENQYYYFYNKIIRETKNLWNIHSTQQVLQYIEDKNIYVEAKTPKGNPSVNAKTLGMLSQEYPIFKYIQYCRKALKQINTYYEPLLTRYTTNEDPVARFDLYQTGTRTGRFSAELIQTAPRQKSKGEIQNNVRAAFITRPGYINLYFDYNQIEMRLFIHFVNHKGLIEAVKQGLDPHTDTAITLFGQDKVNADPSYRQRAKTINFGLIYGQGKAALANALNLPMMEAYKVIKNYYHKYPVREFMDKIMSEIQKTGKLKVKWIGRSYNIPINMAYKGVNALIQGSAAYVLKLALLRVDKYLSSKVPGATILLQMHDELIIEVPDNYNVREVAQKIKEQMEDHHTFRVPITVDTKFSITSWQDKQKW